MEWSSEGAILALWPHGENAAIVEVFCAEKGRHAGVVRGGASRRMAATLQPGTQVAATWRARLGEHMGTFTLEPVRARAGILQNADALAALQAMCALAHMALPEREAQGTFYAATMALLDDLDRGGEWQAGYLRWEMDLLDTLGFGLDLGRCAVTGTREDLAYVSPRTGRAVSRAGAGDWAARLLPLPPALLGQGPVHGGELMQGLALTGHFLNLGLAPLLGGRPLPEARARLLARLARGVS